MANIIKTLVQAEVVASRAVFIKDSDASDFQNPRQLTEHVISDLSFSVEEVAKLLQSIDGNKASGPDNIPPRILKECAMELALPLTNFFHFTELFISM